MSAVEITKDTYLQWYESMLLMRKFEEKAGQLYGQQKIRGFCHLYIGQEAVMAGAMSVLGPKDTMITHIANTHMPLQEACRPTKLWPNYTVKLPDVLKARVVLCICLAKNWAYTVATVLWVDKFLWVRVLLSPKNTKVPPM